MKKYLILILLPAILASCSNWKSLPDKFESFVNEVETSSASFTDKDWDKTEAEYQKMMDTYLEHRDDYSSKDKGRILKASGKYQAMLIVNGIHGVTSYFNNLISTAPDFLEGVEEVIGDAGDNLSDLFEDWLDTSGLEESFDNLSQGVEDIVDRVSDGIEGFLDRLGL